MSIKAPYNFVPVSDEVFFPEWAEKISHDVPFSDCESGFIELQLTSETPVFVRNGCKKGVIKDDPEYFSFSNIQNKYFIPSTSIKGSIRNVLEILSFSKMKRISNERYSIRDLQLRKYLDYFQNSEVHCGWLSMQEGGTAQISDHGIPRRISHTELDQHLGTNFTEIFKSEDFFKNRKDAKTARFKYECIHNSSLEISFTELPLNTHNPVDKRIKVRVDDQGVLYGIIVLTGQPGVRKEKIVDKEGNVKRKASGKFFEFVFPKDELQVFSFDIEEKEGVFRDFLFVYGDSDDWLYWGKVFYHGGSVPVFFSLRDGLITHFGLSYLYKLPSKKRILDFLPPNHRSDKLDMSECIFGTAEQTGGLKGRVQFSHCFLQEGRQFTEKLSPYMGSPRPTYYPIYLQQEGNRGTPSNEFRTFLDDNPKMKGWKRYPVRLEVNEFMMPEAPKAENLNPFIPYDKGSIFSCRIQFHNLRKAELGALILSISPSPVFIHTLGFAKPYGFGHMKIEIKRVETGKCTKDDYLGSFKELMQSVIKDYLNTKQVSELKLMGQAQQLTTPLEYMELKDFVDHKRQKRSSHNKNQLEKTGEYLDYYSSLIKKDIKEVSGDTGEYHAQICVFKYPVFQARLVESENDQPLKLEGFPDSTRFKPGDQILVRKVLKGSKVISLIYIKRVN